MSAIRLRLKGPDGKQHTVSLPAASTVADLFAQAREICALPSVDLLLGFPPALVEAPVMSADASSLVRSGESVLVRASASAPAPASDSSASTGATAAPPAAPPTPAAAGGGWACSTCTLRNTTDATHCMACETPAPPSTDNGSAGRAAAEPSQWPCPACTMLNVPTSASCGACGGSNPKRTRTETGGADSRPGAAAPAGGHGSASLVPQPDDNSCLFHAVAFALCAGECRRLLRPLPPCR